MMAPPLIANVAAYSAQVACIAALGSVLPLLLRIDAAAVRYTYWRALLALCLVLPWLQGRRAATAGDAAPESLVESVVVRVFAASGEAAQSGGTSWLPLAGVIFLAGVAVCLTWIGLGLRHLRRLRTTGRPAPPSGEHEELQRLVGARAEIRYVAGLGQPVTFGALRPVVLLPDTLPAHGPDVERAVLCHELWHVRRRDWAWVLVEESVRAVLWFHPAVWWLISRVRLAREEAVDELVVLVTGARRTYLQALLAFADEAPLAPAAAFGRRRHLFRRMILISREEAMSSRRIVLASVATALMVLAGSWMTVGAFPMMQQGQEGQAGPGPLERRANPITPENPVPRRVYSAAAQYPPEALSSGARGAVQLRITLDESGRVAEVRKIDTFLRGAGTFADAFVRSAVDAVRQWQYEPPASPPISFTIMLGFQRDSEATLIAQDTSPSRPVAGPAGPGASALPAPAWHRGALHVGGAIKPPAKIKDVGPEYPPVALAAGVEGVVIIEARVEADGRVGEMRILRSIPLLDQAALDAVRQWEFRPTLMNGQPVPVIMTITINFSLSPD